jgi:hypothetical protein
MKNYLFLISLTFIFFSCKEELSHPLIIKGVRLGLNYEEQIAIADKNNSCENKVSTENQKCCYMLNEYIIVSPQFLYSFYEDKKVLGQVKLSLKSLAQFPTLTDENGNVIKECDYQCLRMDELEDVISMYNKKYGKGTRDYFLNKKDGGKVIWQIDDLYIQLDFVDALYSYGSIDPQVLSFYQENAYHTTILYRYNDEKIKLLKNDITHKGEVIGDKI